MRVDALQAGSVQQQPLTGKLLAEKLVVFAITVGRITQQVMGNMLHVAAKLVLAPCFGLQLHQ